MPRTRTSWRKGRSGNPNGAPKKGYSITGMMKEMLDAGPSAKKKIGKMLMQKAQNGDMAAIKLLWSYMDGQPQQGLELTGKDGGDIEENLTIELVKCEQAN